jgi:hypothetical protein
MPKLYKSAITDRMEDYSRVSEAILEAHALLLLSSAFQSMQNGPPVAPLLTCELSSHLGPKYQNSTKVQ